MYLDLKQENAQFTGSTKTIGHVWQVHGPVTGDHFEVFFGARDAKPRMTGIVANGKLWLSREGVKFEATPATPTEHSLCNGGNNHTVSSRRRKRYRFDHASSRESDLFHLREKP